ncbi:cyclin-J18 isoform X2 [Cannabis sativa]|uniref:cyclin-J18 isoform X2 n=1 Tax=Cannabis sativa TaxID=3483 RepID=UPI0011DFCDC7|nr:cyclin-J18 isoform X2 [Cannabis sativa]
MWKERALALRPCLLEFLIESAQLLEVSPIVKYTALSFFADRFYPRFSSSRFKEGGDIANWLLQPLRESNLQLFALVSLWISSKIHSSRPLSINCFKSLGDKVIKEQHFTNRDFLEAEVVLMQVLNFEIGAVDIAFTFLEELFHQLREVAKIGDLVNFEACMDIMDILYEKGEISTEHCSSHSLAASTLVASYVITVPKQRWEFPILPWDL